jgi:hypothetical protein
MVIRGHQRSSEVIRGHQRSSGTWIMVAVFPEPVRWTMSIRGFGRLRGWHRKATVSW